ncbi:MAG: galactose mutarotase [Clostridia bacterium]|nr:galactose mutarotase [Clostridia bacterium]
MIEKKRFGEIDGREVSLYILKNDNLEVTLSDYGATIIRVRITLKNGEVRDLVRGYDDLASYMNADGYLGAVVGRVGNRICRGKFSLDGKDYELYCNNGVNHLHGGKIGFDKKIYDVVIDGDSILFSATSPDGEEGYPGKLNYSIKYTLSDNALRLDYYAVTDKATPVNLTNHVYFNLMGAGAIYSHRITLDADRYIPTDDTLIPTGEIASVEGTPFDFREEKFLGAGILGTHKDITLGGGLDHCVVFTDRGEGMHKRVKVTSPDGLVTLKAYTDLPAVQLYSGNFLGNKKFPFRGGEMQIKRAAFCLETENMPDSVNHANFTNTVLRPGEEYKNSTVYEFIAN